MKGMSTVGEWTITFQRQYCCAEWLGAPLRPRIGKQMREEAQLAVWLLLEFNQCSLLL